jgi:hypothetical protein
MLKTLENMADGMLTGKHFIRHLFDFALPSGAQNQTSENILTRILWW